jgi:hypothetical protein
MAEHDVDLGRLLAAGRHDPLDDPHPQGREPQLRVAHEVEKVLERRIAGRQGRDGRKAASIGDDGDGGAVPEAGSHRAGLYRRRAGVGRGLDVGVVLYIV